MAEARRGFKGSAVYQELKRKIITLELAPGQFINERELERQLGIGRTPIREALLTLRVDGLVESQPNKSTFVKAIALKSVRDFFEPFAAVEKLIGRLAPGRITGQTVSSIRVIDRNIRGAVRRRDYWSIFAENRRLHTLIAGSCDNEYVFALHEHLRNHAERLSYLAVSEELKAAEPLKEHLEKICRQHAEIISLLAKRDAQALASLMEEHANLFQQRILLYLQSTSA